MITQVLVISHEHDFVVEYNHEFDDSIINIFKNEEVNSINFTFFWQDQCNFQLSPKLIKFFSSKEMVVAISAQEERRKI